MKYCTKRTISSGRALNAMISPSFLPLLLLSPSPSLFLPLSLSPFLPLSLLYISRDYVFQCVDTSESISAEAYCRPHLCSPLRDLSGCAMAVLDFTLTHHTNALGSQYVHDINKMIKLLTSAFHQAATSTTMESEKEQ